MYCWIQEWIATSNGKFGYWVFLNVFKRIEWTARLKTKNHYNLVEKARNIKAKGIILIWFQCFWEIQNFERKTEKIYCKDLQRQVLKTGIDNWHNNWLERSVLQWLVCIFNWANQINFEWSSVLKERRVAWWYRYFLRPNFKGERKSSLKHNKRKWLRQISSFSYWIWDT